MAFHHAGLSLGARRLIEILFRGGDLKAVVATPTLAAGVNLPAGVVLVPVRRFDGGSMAPIPIMEYKQMAGRAGRPNLSKEGLSIIYDSEGLANRFIFGDPEPINPKLADKRNLRIHLNSLLAMGIGERAVDVLKKSFSGFLDMIDEEAIRDAMAWLEEEGFIEGYDPTKLGKITSKMYLDPLSVSVLLKMVSEAKPSTVEEMLYMVAVSPDIQVKFSVSRGEEEVLREYSWVIDKWEEVSLFDIYPVLKTIAVLMDWINERDDREIFDFWKIGPGDLFSLRENAEWVTHGFSAVLDVVGFNDLADEFRVLEMRIAHGVSEKLLELVKLKGIGRVRARILWDAGFRSIEDLMVADPNEILKLPKFGKSVVESLFEQLGRKVRVEDKKAGRTLDAFIKR